MTGPTSEQIEDAAIRLQAAAAGVDVETVEGRTVDEWWDDRSEVACEPDRELARWVFSAGFRLPDVETLTRVLTEHGELGRSGADGELVSCRCLAEVPWREFAAHQAAAVAEALEVPRG